MAGRFGWTLTDALNVDYVFRWTDGETELDNFGADSLTRELFTSQFFQRIQAQSLLWDGALEQKFGFSFTDFSCEDTQPGFGQPRFDGQTQQLDYQMNLLLSDNNTLTAGVDYLHEQASSTATRLQSQHNTGVYLQDQIRLAERWFTTVGVRWDD